MASLTNRHKQRLSLLSPFVVVVISTWKRRARAYSNKIMLDKNIFN